MQALRVEREIDGASDLRHVLRRDAGHNLISAGGGVDEDLVADRLDEVEGERRGCAVTPDHDVFGADAEDHRASFRDLTDGKRDRSIIGYEASILDAPLDEVHRRGGGES